MYFNPVTFPTITLFKHLCKTVPYQRILSYQKKVLEQGDMLSFCSDNVNLMGTTFVFNPYGGSTFCSCALRI